MKTIVYNNKTFALLEDEFANKCEKCCFNGKNIGGETRGCHCPGDFPSECIEDRCIYKDITNDPVSI